MRRGSSVIDTDIMKAGCTADVRCEMVFAGVPPPFHDVKVNMRRGCPQTSCGALEHLHLVLEADSKDAHDVMVFRVSSWFSTECDGS